MILLHIVIAVKNLADDNYRANCNVKSTSFGITLQFSRCWWLDVDCTDMLACVVKGTSVWQLWHNRIHVNLEQVTLFSRFSDDVRIFITSHSRNSDSHITLLKACIQENSDPRHRFYSGLFYSDQRLLETELSAPMQHIGKFYRGWKI